MSTKSRLFIVVREYNIHEKALLFLGCEFMQVIFLSLNYRKRPFNQLLSTFLIQIFIFFVDVEQVSSHGSLHYVGYHIHRRMIMQLHGYPFRKRIYRNPQQGMYYDISSSYSLIRVVKAINWNFYSFS